MGEELEELTASLFEASNLMFGGYTNIILVSIWILNFSLPAIWFLSCIIYFLNCDLSFAEKDCNTKQNYTE